MPDANEQQGDCDPTGSGPVPMFVPNEAPEGVQLGDDLGEAGEDEEPQEPEEPLEPYQIVLQGFRTVSQTLSAAYGATSAEIQIIVRKSLVKTTAEDWTFVWGADTPVWTHAGPAKDSSSSSDSISKSDSGLGSNPSIQPRRGTDTESR